jgi:hypothetical protein
MNTPSFLTAVGAGTFLMLPIADAVFSSEKVAFKSIKGAALLAYVLSVVSVSRPGRYDGQVQLSGDDKDSPGAKEMKQMGTGKQGRTLLPPAGWAFAIWGPIFLGELVMVSTLFFMDESSPVAPIFRKMAAPYLAAHVFQTLWTASFRPKYKETYKKYISVTYLTLTSFALSHVHAAYTIYANTKPYSSIEYMLCFFPLSLHFGWTTAAALVNLNGMVALEETVSAKNVAWLGHVSVIGAAVAGCLVTIERQAPVYGGVIAWALSAVASGLTQRLRETQKEDSNRVGVYGVQTQKTLSVVGAAVCACASLVTAANLASKSKA